MRPSTLVTPLLLIAIGALLLVSRLYPDIALIDHIARYWPVLLIGWGVLRFIEIVFWWATDRALPFHGISGGEWTLIIFLSLAGFSLHAARGFYNWLPASGIQWGGLEVFGNNYDYPLSAEAAASAAPRIVIESFDGSARIVGGDVQMVTISGRTSIRAMNQEEADRANEASTLEIAGDTNQVIIRPEQNTGGGPAAMRITSDIEITVPRGASIQARGGTADFDISNVMGEVDIDADRSGIRLEGIGSNVRLNLRNSDLIRAVNVAGAFDLKGRGDDIDLEAIQGRVTVDGSYTGLTQFRNLTQPVHWIGPQTEITAQAITGDLRMTLGDINASNLTGPVRINSRTKDIWLTGVTESLDVTVDRGDLTLDIPNTPVPRITARTQAGNVEIALPQNGGFTLNATTNRGEALNDYGDQIREERDNRGASLRGSPRPGPAIDVSVGRGRLFLRRAGEILPENPGEF